MRERVVVRWAIVGLVAISASVGVLASDRVAARAKHPGMCVDFPSLLRGRACPQGTVYVVRRDHRGPPVACVCAVDVATGRVD